MKEALERLYGDFLEREWPQLYGRGYDLSPVPGKALALIGMRRVGKTYLCYQRIQELLGDGLCTRATTAKPGDSSCSCPENPRLLI